jgi:alanyl-tRNA synthetase
MRPAKEVDSALHVLKGAVQSVLGTPLTTSTYGEGSHGRLTVEYEGKPTDEQMREIERLANGKIHEDVPIETLHIDKREAEQKYGNVIYDKFPIPAHVQKLTLSVIEGWNINCCLGPHVKTTGEIGKIQISSHRARPNRKELEISFDVIAS